MTCLECPSIDHYHLQQEVSFLVQQVTIVQRDVQRHEELICELLLRLRMVASRPECLACHCVRADFGLGST